MRMDSQQNVREEASDVQGVGEQRAVQRLVFLSFACNCVLLVCKVFATLVSGSLTVLASTLDSFLDILSGAILYFAHRAMRATNYYVYPAGKSRLEPLGVIVFASVMFTATLTIFIESIKSLFEYDGAKGVRGAAAAAAATSESESASDEEAQLQWIIVGVMCGTVVAKALLFVTCRWVLRTHVSPTLAALAQDHFNDTLTNAFGAVALILTFFYRWWIDAVAACIIAAWIMMSWARTGWEHVVMLSGKSADPEFLSQLTYVCWNHSPKILAIDTVRAFHLSFGYLVEVDIVLPPEMELQEAHDIGEHLQWKIESLDQVERCFVHLDYEFSHKPEHICEHRPEFV